MSWTDIEPDVGTSYKTIVAQETCQNFNHVATTSSGSLHHQEHVFMNTSQAINRAQRCEESDVIQSKLDDESVGDMTNSATWTSMLDSIEGDSLMNGRMSRQSDEISSVASSRDSLKQLQTIAAGRAFPEMQPMMKRYLRESEGSVNVTQPSDQQNEFTFGTSGVDCGSSQFRVEPSPASSTFAAQERTTTDDIQISAASKPTSTWINKILLPLLFVLAILALSIGSERYADESTAVSDHTMGQVGSYVWSLKEKLGLIEVEYDTEAVASALLDQMMSLQGAYLATCNHLSAPDKDLQYQPMWQYAVKVRAESNLPARDELARDLARLGDVVSDLSEETAVFSTFYTSEFSSIALEFEKLGNVLLLSDRQKQPGFTPRGPYDRRRVDVSSAIRSFTFAVQSRLNGMQRYVEQALAPARQAVISSRNLIHTLSIDETRLRRELRSQPAWQSWGHLLKEVLVGVEGPNVRQALLADLAVSKKTIESLYPLANALEETRSRLVVQKKSIEMFSAASLAFRIGPSSGPRSYSAEGYKTRLVEAVSGFRTSLHVKAEGQLLARSY